MITKSKECRVKKIKHVEYKTVDTKTLKGLRLAERLHDQGWIMVRTGLFLIQFSNVEIVRKSRKK